EIRRQNDDPTVRRFSSGSRRPDRDGLQLRRRTSRAALVIELAEERKVEILRLLLHRGLGHRHGNFLLERLASLTSRSESCPAGSGIKLLAKTLESGRKCRPH